MPERVDDAEGALAEDALAEDALDVLLDAVEAVPAGQLAWDLDLLRTALRIARATEAPDDLRRAALAWRALAPDSRARLAEGIAEATRRVRRRLVPVGRPERRSGVAAIVATLVGRPVSAGTGETARARLMRDVQGPK